MSIKVCNIQNFSLHDGPGIRTTFFLSGCPLRCVWCHNPETQNMQQQILFESKKCIGCGGCVQVCSNGAQSAAPSRTFIRENCMSCGACVATCPTKALRLCQQEMSTEAVVDYIQKQRIFYEDKGGVTFSGGEPLLQTEAIVEIAKLANVHTAVETCGYVKSDLFCKALDVIDYFLYDIKLFDDEKHKTFTGVSNKLILENFETLKQSGKPFLVRTPLIPGITDTEENLSAIERFIGDAPWEKLKYNTLAPTKYEWLGKTYECPV